jgi:hypothetical protein
MDNLQMKSSNKNYTAVKSAAIRHAFWQRCGENDCKKGGHDNSGRSRVDPALKLYPGCPVMMTTNANVPCGQANGTRARHEHVTLKPGGIPFTVTLTCGTKVQGVNAFQLESVTLRQSRFKVSASGIQG